MAEPSFDLLDSDFFDFIDLFSKDFEFKKYKENVKTKQKLKVL